MSVATSQIRAWRENPLLFVSDNFRVEPDEWQRDLLIAFADPKKSRIAMKACKGPGKTAGLAWCIWNFMTCYAERGEHPKGAAVAITEDNLKDNLWPELAKWRARSPFLKGTFDWQKERICAKKFPETWFFSARSWPKSADISQQSNTLAGLHSEYLMFVLDESGGIPDAVMAAAEGGLATGKWTKILQAGNPTHRTGPLYRACTSERHLWHVITITGDPNDPNRSPRINVQWANEQIEKYGRNNPWVMINVFGEFPPDSLNALMGPDEVEKAMRRRVKNEDFIYAQKRIGIDVARFGDDRCFDDQTEILTDQGWKYFCDLDGGERVLSVNGEKSSWQPILHIHKSSWDGHMNLYEKRHINFCITDNHRMLVKTTVKSESYKFESYKNLPKKFVVREKNGWDGKSPLIREFKMIKRMPNGGSFGRRYSFMVDDWSSFLGWFVSEGNVYVSKKRKNSYRIIITQNPGVKMKKIKNLLDRMCLKWRMCPNGNQVEFSNVEIGKWLIDNCGIKAKNKMVPKEIKDGDEKTIKNFLDSFLLGDGTHRKNGMGKTHVTSSKRLADDIQEMLVKIGKAGSLVLKNKAGTQFKIGKRTVVRRNDTYIVYEKNGNDGKYVIKKDVKRIHYKGFVWCIATPYESFVVRRKGIPMWSGNTVLFPRQGLISFRPVEMRNARTNDIASRTIMAKAKWNSEVEYVDDTGGYGAGVIDSMLQSGHTPQAINFSGKADDPKYYNKRAEMWFRMADWIKRGGSLPPIREMVAELTTPTYTFARGKFRIEDKGQIKSRLGLSPDYADALCLVGSTTVNVPNGYEKIKEIKVGDFVCTPMGDKRVVRVWESETDVLSKVKFSNGNTLEGKPSHKIFTWDSGWVKMDALSMDNSIESDSAWRRLKWILLRKLFMRKRHFGFKEQVDIISQGGNLRRRDFFIGVSMLSILEKFKRDIVSIIKMVTGQIMQRKILNPLSVASIKPSICVKGCKTLSIREELSKIYPGRRTQQKSGIEVLKERNGTQCTEKEHGSTEKRKSRYALCAAQLFNATLNQGENSVRLHVAKRWDTLKIKHLTQNAWNAAKNLLSTSIGISHIVPVHVQTERVSRKIKTYNLTVEDENVYYANGILVANCLTFAQVEMPTSQAVEGMFHAEIGHKSDYDPFDERRM